MLKNETKIRVRYGETDQMGIVNNANYASYFEIGRSELFRELGLSYKSIEEAGVLLPLSDLYVKYRIPAYYEDLLTILTEVKQWPAGRIRFDYTIKNQKGECINEGYTIHGFIRSESRKPMRLPLFIEKVIKPFFFDKD